jgi:PhzF family phenazine biosynthesis protein
MRLRIVDAFTDRPFAGNPAAIVLLDTNTWPPENWMRQIASEMSLSETAFAYKLTGSNSADWGLRWFTPVVEDDLCGHATLAAAHVINTDISGPGTIRFLTRSGVLTAQAAPNGEITLDFPAAPIAAQQVPAGLADALGSTPKAAFSTGTLRDLLVVYPDESAVRGLRPDMSAVAALTQRWQLRAITTTAAADAATACDFVSRFFSPADGIPEDPVTGSAHTALAPYWMSQLGRNNLIGLQASARSGMVRTVVAGNRVLISGRAVTVLDGTLHHVPRAEFAEQPPDAERG